MATLITSPYVHTGRAPRKESGRESDKAVRRVPRVAGPRGRMLSLVPNLEPEAAMLRARTRRPKSAGDGAQP